MKNKNQNNLHGDSTRVRQSDPLHLSCIHVLNAGFAFFGYTDLSISDTSIFIAVLQ